MFNLKNEKIYLDTSVISALFDERAPERMRDTELFWDFIKNGFYDIYISDVTLFEVKKCFEPRQSQMIYAISEIDYTLIEETDTSLEITDRYLNYGVLTEKSRDDCRHIAIASLADCNYISSWNFKHFVNIKTINKVQGINKILGLREINILPPSMFLGDEA